MIIVKISKENNNIKSILFKGHALYDDYGKDIVCAGASSILITTVNAILKYQEDAIEYTIKKDVLITILKMDNVINILINNMIDLLKELQENYPKNIIIREDEDDE